VSSGSDLGPPQRHSPRPSLVKQPRTSPAQPHRQLPAQRGPEPDSDHPGAIPPPAREFLQRRRAAGDTKTESIRALKRRLSDTVHRALLADVSRAATDEPINATAAGHRSTWTPLLAATLATQNVNKQYHASSSPGTAFGRMGSRPALVVLRLRNHCEQHTDAHLVPHRGRTQNDLY
jgi:hypothetical protein